MRRLVVRLYPRRWRNVHGEGLAELLEQTQLSVGVVVDCVRGAGDAHMRTRRPPLAVVLAVLWFELAEMIAIRTGVIANVLWAPTSAVRGLALVSALLPPAALLRRATCRPSAS